MKTFKLKYSFPLLFLFFIFNILHADNINTRAFTNVQLLGEDSITINGAILQIGNQILCKNDDDYEKCEAPELGTPNNSNTQHFARIDSNVTHSNSMAKLLMEDDDEVIYAGLYWSARIYDTTDTELINAKTIKIKGPNSTVYTSFTSLDSKFNWHNDEDDINSGTLDYGASADVTDYIKANRDGEYYVGDITSETGTTSIYASWQLIVVVKNSARSLKNIAIYDGFYSIFNSDPYPSEVTVDAGGFITPTGSDPFDAFLYVYAGETDTPYGDSSEIKDGNDNWVSLVDGANTPTDVMNASVSSPDYTGGYRFNDTDMASPNFENVLGVDIDKLQINDKLDTSKQILSNSQTSTQIKLTSTGDRYSLNMFAFETEVFVPEFCYDYAYKQQGKYFTEENDGTQNPRLTGDVVPGEPIEVTIFLKSMVDGTIQIQNMYLHVSDINNTQASLITDSVKLAKIGTLIPTTPAYTTSTVGDQDLINDIDIGTLNQNDYFYTYYTLDPSRSTMDMPITVEATYNLVLDATSVSYNLLLSREIPLCSTNNFEYTPAKGIFNIAHNDYYTYDQGSGGTKYYNLPTQVTKREGNFKVLAMDPDNFDELLFEHTGTVVSVEMIDAGAFHFTEASCKEMASSISKRVWVILDENVTSVSFNQAALQAAIDNSMTELSSTTEFYTMARQNAAFRITYNSMDGNDTLPYLAKDDHGGTDSWSLLNWNSAWTGEDCAQDMVTNGLGNDNSVASYCNFTGGSPDSVAKCMECIYGLNTKFVCSRDNFSIRPEAFLLKLNDQNQTTPGTTSLRLADDVSGLNSPNESIQVEMAAGYNYLLELNATNHLGNEASLGYTRTFGTGSQDIIEYQWAPSTTLTGCNDTNNSTLNFKIVNGEIDLNTSLAQVGEYRLHMHDETWTDVDHNPLYMAHHNEGAPFFYLPSVPDCVIGDSTTQVVNSSTINGCDINSEHNTSAVGVDLEYRDYDVEFHPYDFNLTITPTVGINHAEVNATSYIYMSDITTPTDENMSYHLNGSILAQDYNGSTVSNFVANCYAKPLDIDIVKSDTTLLDTNGNPIFYQYIFHDVNSSKGIISTIDGNDTAPTAPLTIQVTDGNFTKIEKGVMITLLNLNYNREVNRTANPKAISFSTYDVNCTNAATECTFNADLIASKTTQGTKDLNATINVKHYYGRTNAPRNRFVGPTGNAFIYYEVYCNGLGCDKTLLQNGLNSKTTDDPRWFKNEAHRTTTYGMAGNYTSNVTQKVPTGVTPLVTVSALDNNVTAQSTATVTYDTSAGKGYPYKATMLDKASAWLIYNKYNANADANEFEVEFVNTNSAWAGKTDTSSTTDNNGSKKTNRRSMW